MTLFLCDKNQKNKIKTVSNQNRKRKKKPIILANPTRLMADICGNLVPGQEDMIAKKISLERKHLKSQHSFPHAERYKFIFPHKLIL